MKYLVYTSILLLSSFSFCQNIEDLPNLTGEEQEEVIDNRFYGYGEVKQNAQFIGGRAPLNNYIKSNLKYPNFEYNHNFEGVVYVTLVVDKDSSLSNIKIVRGSTHLGFNKEALSLVNNMPKWIPAMKSDKTIVRQRLEIPIKFKTKE